MAEQDRSASAARDAARLLAGLADLGLEAAEGALRRARAVLARSDLPEMASDLHREVKAHGDVVLDRVAPPAQAHMEALARRAATTRQATTARQTAAAREKSPKFPNAQKSQKPPKTPEA